MWHQTKSLKEEVVVGEEEKKDEEVKVVGGVKAPQGVKTEVLACQLVEYSVSTRFGLIFRPLAKMISFIYSGIELHAHTCN